MSKTHSQAIAELNHDGINANNIPVGGTVELICCPGLNQYYFLFHRVSADEWVTATRYTPTYGPKVFTR
jgi:hypothetical protein